VQPAPPPAADLAALELDKSAATPDKPVEPPAITAPATPGSNRTLEFRTDAWSEAYIRRIDDTIAALKTSVSRRPDARYLAIGSPGSAQTPRAFATAGITTSPRVSVVVTANPRVAVRCPRVARVVAMITVRAVSKTQAKAERGHAEAPDEAATVKAGPANKRTTRKAGSRTCKVATADPRGGKAASNTTANTTGDKTATGDSGGGKAASNTTAAKATTREATSKAASASSEAGVAHPSTTKAATVASPAAVAEC
jgi:hypothetical protein